MSAGWARQLGWDAMCRRNDQPVDFCNPAAGPDLVELSQFRDLLMAVNELANANYVYRSDRAIYGQADYWTVPIGNAADCEDFVLLKMMHLEQAGLPFSAMSIVAGNLRNGNWHSVLLVHTDSGTYVLDNLRSEVVTFDASAFSDAYVMSMRDTGRWWPIAR